MAPQQHNNTALEGLLVPSICTAAYELLSKASRHQQEDQVDK